VGLAGLLEGEAQVGPCGALLRQEPGGPAKGGHSFRKATEFLQAEPALVPERPAARLARQGPVKIDQGLLRLAHRQQQAAAGGPQVVQVGADFEPGIEFGEGARRVAGKGQRLRQPVAQTCVKGFGPHRFAEQTSGFAGSARGQQKKPSVAGEVGTVGPLPVEIAGQRGGFGDAAEPDLELNRAPAGGRPTAPAQRRQRLAEAACRPGGDSCRRPGLCHARSSPVSNLSS
jgi:hypothetical protein